MPQAPIIVASPPATLIPLAEIKTLLGIGDTSQDVLLDQHGAVVTDLLRAHLGRIINQLSLVVTFKGVNAGRVWLPNPPIDTVTSALLDGVAVADMDFNAMSGRLWGGGWLQGDDLVVTYDAGFDPEPPVVVDVYKNLVNARINAAAAGSEGAAAGPIRSLTVFDSHKVDYDTGAATTGGALGELGPYEAMLRPYIHHGELAA